MEPLLLQHAWLAGLALLAPAYLLSRRDGAGAQIDAGRTEATIRPQAVEQPNIATRVPMVLPPADCGAARLRTAAVATASRPLRVVRVIDPSQTSSGRLRISGRMADVCAELDRLAAREALQAS